MLADAVLGPFTPSVTARSGGTIYPVLNNLPALYGSKPNDPSARRIGSYIMWVAIASTCVTSSLFLTALAPNLLALEIVKSTVHIQFSWLQWFYAAAPMGILLLLAVPLLGYWLYRPEIVKGDEIPDWAGKQLVAMGALSRREATLAVLVMAALLFWIFGDKIVDPTTTALMVIVLMLVTSVVTWDDLMKNSSAWNTLTWFSTLVALAAGLAKVGFIAWFAATIGQKMSGLSPVATIVLLIGVFYFSHYMFASITAHATAILPVILALGLSIPGLPMGPLALLLCMTLGIMGILTPYAAGPSPVYYGSGYLPSGDYWRLGGIFGVIFFAVFMAISVPWVLIVGQATFLAPH
jgi:L-tartrate/succinate antiporter